MSGQSLLENRETGSLVPNKHRIEIKQCLKHVTQNSSLDLSANLAAAIAIPSRLVDAAHAQAEVQRVFAMQNNPAGKFWEIIFLYRVQKC